MGKKLIERIKKIKSSSQKLKVSDLTVEELEKLIEGSKSLAKENAKSEGGCISNCRFTELLVGGGDTAHGGLPWLVSHQPATI